MLRWGTNMASPYKIHLDRYDGPLDLLLDLIKKQEIDIHNIPISKITGQYLEYLHKLEQLDMDVSADFIYMAATLIYIKSKMLLPPDPLAGPEDSEDPRADLVHRLVEHEKFKSAAQLLHQRQQIEENVRPRPDVFFDLLALMEQLRGALELFMFDESVDQIGAWVFGFFGAGERVGRQEHFGFDVDERRGHVYE